MRVLKSVSVTEFQLELADMPSLSMFSDVRLRNFDTTREWASPDRATIRIVADAFEQITFYYGMNLFRVFRAGEPMPGWVDEFLNQVLPDDMGFALDNTADGHGV
jgi:hypothetical protein